ncbi:MAG: protein kinase [Verrucomicrobiota bacterium]
MTESSRTCPDCDSSLPPDSPKELCPSCLLKQAFASRTVAEPSTPQPPPPSPEEIAGKFPQFEVTECLGRGGMGVVYKARQKSLNRWVAIKILAPERVGDETFAERFSREARTLAQLNHPNIVTVHDYGETDGLYYIVMEYVDGVNLRDLLHDGKIESAQALTIVPPVCEALQYAHDKGIVHRDIKPENLLIDREGRVKIADFGIASLVGATGELSGTPPYMAPEQGSQGNVDHRADIYALGAVLYEMLTGERPASPLDVPSQRVQVDVRIDDIVLRALSKEPERRYRTANEFRTVVETVVDREPGTSPSSAAPSHPHTHPPSEQPPRKGIFRRWWWVILLSFLAGPFLGAATYFFVGALAPRKYEATSVIQIRPLDLETGSQDLAQTHFDRLMSKEALEHLSEKVDLPRRWMLTKRETIDRLKQSITLQQIRGTDLIEIRARSTIRTEAARIANELTTYHVETAPPGTVTIHEVATRPDRHLGPSRKGLLLAAPIGLVLSPLLGIAFAALLQWIFPQRGSSQTKADTNPVFQYLALGLLLIGILGSLAMFPFTRNGEFVLIFGAVAIALGLLFGLKTSWAKAIKILLVVAAVIGLLAFVVSSLIFVMRSASLQREADTARQAAIEDAAAAQQQAERKLLEETATRFMQAIQKIDPDAAHAQMMESAYGSMFPELSDEQRAGMRRDFREMNLAYQADPSRMLRFSEWHRNGGFATCRVMPPKGGDGNSLYLILGLSPKGWRIVEVNDIRLNDPLKQKLEAWLEANRVEQ